MGFKCQSKLSFSSLSHFSSRNNTDFFPILIEQNPPNPPRQDSPIPSLPREQTPRQPTPGPSGTQWSEELFREPSRTEEPPIPGPSPLSQPPEDDTTCEPKPEVAPTQSTEEPFARPATPRSIIIINNTPVGSPLLLTRLAHLPLLFPPQCPREPQRLPPPVQRPSHSNDEALQEFTNLRPTLMIPRAIVHKSINQILLEHCHLLHMIPFVDATHQNEMHWEFWEEPNSHLSQEL
ncbi:hypothetical protein O181_077471 [Austropuccinia psidii MF-1]|uniref:Uncharacterized protein n=1 Tax=Austropuccinia psidii MF-1 TaxID=1389203 RepID=A0A9Q3FI52_9BASI|nr:hypothetical protein [Austropuccinia psidii MF-1]